MSFLPRSRTQEYQNNDDGTQTVRCYSPLNPHYYKDGDGNYHSIDLSHTSSLNNSNVGNFTLKDKNIHSLGIRQDDNKEKYIGIRPDETQDGSQQFEWTIISASVNSENVPIDLSKNDFVDNNQVDLGNVTLFSTRRYARQMLHYTSSINDFKVEYKLHLTGLKVSGSKYTSSTTLSNSNNVSVDTTYYKENNSNEFIILDDNNNVKYKITEPVLLNSNFKEVQTSGSVHTLKDNGDGTYNYTKYPASSSINNISSSVNYIDATTVYSTAGSDGYVEHANAANWATAEGASSGTSVDTSGDTIETKENGISLFGGLLATIRRGFLSFDTSDISEGTDVLFYGHWTTVNTKGLIFVEWDEGPTLTTADYNGFTSTAYSGEIDSSDVTTGQYSSASLNSDALTAINDNDRLDMMARGHFYDYGASSIFSNTNIQNIFYSSDETGTSKDPYISVTLPSDEAVLVFVPTVKILSGTFDLKNGNLRIK
jgi:hypothetical protein